MSKASNKCVQSHTIIITDRGGHSRVAELKDVTEVRWNRLIGQRSTATITISGSACRRQTAKLAKIEPRRHEAVIYRGDLRVWEGPIRYVKNTRDAVTITAYDVLDYCQGRPLVKYWPGPENGGPSNMTARVEAILRHELATAYTAPGTADLIPAWEGVVPSAQILPFLDVRPGTVSTSAETLPYTMTVLEHLEELARSGLSFTTVGRRIVVWDSAHSIGQTRVFTESDIDGDPALYVDGDGLVTVQHVVAPPENGALETETYHVGSFARDVDYYGPWAKIHSRSDEGGEWDDVQVALSSQAKNLSAGSVPVPVDIVIGSGSTIRLDSSLGINDLVAGMDMPVIARIMGREVRRTQRLQSLEVTETASGETVQGSIAGKTSDEG